MNSNSVAVKAKWHPSQDYLCDNLWYNPDTGDLFWVQPGPRRKLFRRATFIQKRMPSPHWRDRSDILVALNGRVFMASRLIWIMNYGPIPRGLTIDHIDGNPLNNRLENLRTATAKQQAQNRARPMNNSTGHVGVRQNWNKHYWEAWVGTKRIGVFGSKREAAERVQSARLLQGYHPNHGRD